MERFIKDEGNVFPGKTYEVEMLKPIFNDQRDFLFPVMFDIHRAHVIMLAEQNIIPRNMAKEMLIGISKVAEMDRSTIQYEPRYEDLFFMMEAKIGEEIGYEFAGNMHIGRSRNDMGIGMYRLVLRDHLLELIDNAYTLLEVLLKKAEEHKETIITGYTHTQPAQPTTLGHYFLAIYDITLRDCQRLWAAYKTVNQSPLGAAALTTTGFPISRERMCELLGFDSILENSYDCIGGADYLLEVSSVMMTSMVNAGRWIQDFLQHVTREFGTFNVADPYVQISSIMPQKRNPVSIEHARAKASSSYGEAYTAMNMIHNTPFGDIVDTEDDLQPHLYNAFLNANRVFKLMYAVIATLEVNKERAKFMANQSCIAITELADTLTRDYTISFRKAHKIASYIAKQTTQNKMELFDWKIEDVNEMIQGFVEVTLTEETWKKIISPEYFVHVRKIQGGPNPDEVSRMIKLRQENLVNDRLCYEETIQELLTKKNRLLNYEV
ncbi:argininosuccinate lyase [Bacillus sp. 2205SS5-2]|uniref:argininosuccinate lyase n=1 Tax=Bacillus sp. 2205SS5-2 TaxID=3109031 RepID=UPI003004CBD0